LPISAVRMIISPAASCWRMVWAAVAGDETAAQEQIRQSVTIYADIGQAHDSWQAEIWQLMEW
ncbi:MAG: hypothetical protein KC445_08415, partial [Anaerolineales bacterium]|nr:hypothetical protein [Anaerolineales bacterium]